MNPAATEAIIGVITLIVSVIVSVYASGRNAGRNEQRLKDVENTVGKLAEFAADVKSLAKDVAEIKGMFVLRLRDSNDPEK